MINDSTSAGKKRFDRQVSIPVLVLFFAKSLTLDSWSGFLYRETVLLVQRLNYWPVKSIKYFPGFRQ